VVEIFGMRREDRDYWLWCGGEKESSLERLCEDIFSGPCLYVSDS